MGEDPSTGSSQVTESRDPEEIREEIETTREELGETIAALGEKADVKTRAREKVDDIKDQAGEKVAGARESVSGTKDDLLGKAKDVSPDAAASAATQAAQKVRENPAPLAIAGAFIAGVVLGRLSNR
jgi:ElaB/YqjD/DUF883 family membrane-anchored ribosome-binding protein